LTRILLIRCPLRRRSWLPHFRMRLLIIRKRIQGIIVWEEVKSKHGGTWRSNSLSNVYCSVNTRDDDLQMTILEHILQ
jgi:hypothetical protein